MKIKNARFPRLFPSKSKKTAPRQPERSSGGGRLYGFWRWIRTLAAGFALGWFGMVCLSVVLEENIRPLRSDALISAAADTVGDLESMHMTAFLATNPFKVTPMPAPEMDTDGVSSGDEPVVITGDLATAILKWPLPKVGAVLESQGKQHVVMIGQSFDIYVLDKVTRDQALFRKDGELVAKDLILDRSPQPRSAPAAAGTNTPSSPQAGAGQIIAAEPGEKEGQISNELITQLMQNPFDELGRVRLRPSQEEQGFHVQWINNKDSILSHLGVKKDDVIRSINGIPFNNMEDITNSMNSLMNSDRFDVEIIRDGQATSLRYVVR